MALRPMLQRDPRFADVQSGASTGMQQYAPGVRFSDSSRTAGDSQALSDLRNTSYLRPMLQGNSDGSPMSAADMESRQNAAGALDDFFTNAPDRQRLQESEAAAQYRQNEELAQDPLYKERGTAQIQFDQKDALAQLGEMRRQKMMSNYADQLSAMSDYYDKAIKQATSSGDVMEAKRLSDEQTKEEERMGTRFGFGSKDEKNYVVGR